MTSSPHLPAPDRRRFLTLCSALGLGQTLLPGTLFTLAAQAQTAQADPKAAKITPEMIDAAAAIAGIVVTDEQKAMLLDGLTQQRDSIETIRSLHIQNATAPAVVFNPIPSGMALDTIREPIRLGPAPSVHHLATAGPSAQEAIAFATVRELSVLLKTRKLTSLDLTKLYLARLKKYDPRLHFVITLTEDRALKQAATADAELAASRHRGPLHGIPWGAKDLLSVKGYPTTWGAAGFEHQHFDIDATVVQRLDEAGAVLLAKLSMGALAQGDLWFGGRTRNPWNLRQGASGSSAGSASATSAGCVAFAIGTETLGSIASPATRCGVTGLRPTFGLVPRTGAMALSWSMDKIGPMCRSAEDCALVLSVIYGPEAGSSAKNIDRAVQPAAFNWDANFDWRQLRIGYLKSAFDVPAPPALKPPTEPLAGKVLQDFQQQQKNQQDDLNRTAYDLKYATAALATIRQMGVTLIPVDLPHGLHFGDQTPLLTAEAAAAFDELTLSGRDKLLTGQQPYDWPNSLRRARFYSAVDYIQAQRARSLTIDAMAELFRHVDIIVTPSDGAQLSATNLSGHPAIIVPNGLRGKDAPKPQTDEDASIHNTGGPNTPVSITFLGALYTDARLAAFAHAYQNHTSFHKLHPKLD
ncbi:amidase [Granulicella arctica]|uniref:Asp-tRNA(Asn)/Glu-tRNA(Gln) amidotransferase A subunit family amidase n=1 Tax=Granulicella arctica TaxID=940613 RepID=A0A7Y9PH70_9BACT|nr:amidase [Granulicella arctica]NYF79116.1 Asp-tRNA(Asn)/Glu-tRNA(Gln) amidotransferase A subunit family amidase [Granulicella arctica]